MVLNNPEIYRIRHRDNSHKLRSEMRRNERYHTSPMSIFSSYRSSAPCLAVYESPKINESTLGVCVFMCLCVCLCYLCPRDGSEGIGRSQDRLVVHDMLWGHHGNTPHLMTHLRRELARRQVREHEGGITGEGPEPAAC